MSNIKSILKWFFKSLIIALILLFIINVVGSFLNINIPVNVWTILVIFFLRLPGAIILVIFFLI